MKRMINSIAMTVIALFMTACGGGSSTTWGIDNSDFLPTCAVDVNDTSSAIFVPGGTAVKSLTTGTTLRVWHYSNGDKLVCVITGSAIITGGN